jgi:hypothetical protein
MFSLTLVIIAGGALMTSRLGAAFTGYVQATSRLAVTEDDLWVWIVATIACVTVIAAGYAIDALI